MSRRLASISLQHFEQYGWKEGRNPNALFDVKGYLATYGDVAAAGVNPLDHYHTSGLEGGTRPSSPNFDTTSTSRQILTWRLPASIRCCTTSTPDGTRPFAVRWTGCGDSRPTRTVDGAAPVVAIGPRR